MRQHAAAGLLRHAALATPRRCATRSSTNPNDLLLLRSSSYNLSDWSGGRGHDLTYESLTYGGDERYGPKVVLDGYGPSGFDVMNLIKKVDPKEKSDGSLHMHGSVLVFPYACFLWNVEHPHQVTVSSLAPVLLHRQPPLSYLFLGSNQVLPHLNHIKEAFRKRNIVVEQLNLINAIGTFNILNAEDRQVATALLLDPNEDEDDD